MHILVRVDHHQAIAHQRHNPSLTSSKRVRISRDRTLGRANTQRPYRVARPCGGGAGTGRQINAKAPGQPNYESGPDRTGHLSPAATGTATTNSELSAELSHSLDQGGAARRDWPGLLGRDADSVAENLAAGELGPTTPTLSPPRSTLPTPSTIVETDPLRISRDR
jgi:hypothetical protein